MQSMASEKPCRTEENRSFYSTVERSWQERTDEKLEGESEED